MAKSRIQIQPSLSMPEFLKGDGTEAQCEQVLEAVRGPEGFRYPRRAGTAHIVVRDGVRKVFQCVGCRHQASLIVGTLFQGTNLPLTIWFLAIYLISQAKTGLSALALKRPVGVNYPTARLMNHKRMQAMADREDRDVLEGKAQVDDAYLGGERTGGKVGRGSENKTPFVAAVSLSEDNRPIRVRLTPVAGFTLKAISSWAKDHLAPTSTVFSDGLACFGAVTEAGCSHLPTLMAGRKPKEVLEFRWINTVLGNLKTSFSGCYHAHVFDFQRYAARYLAAFRCRFNRRFDLRTLHQRLIIAAASTIPHPMRAIHVADVH